MEWIVTRDVFRETWRRLKEFANEDIAVDAIASIHGPAANASTTANYRKQAAQIRTCLLQAEEYFRVSGTVTIYTKPTVIYYGMTSLASAVMLLLGDGSKSFDQLRKDPKKRAHGLHFTVSIRRSEASSGTKLLESSRVEILPDGHFPTWYSTLPLTCPALARVTRVLGDATLTNYESVGTGYFHVVSKLVGKKWRLLDLTYQLPDLVDSLSRYGLAVAHTRVNYEVRIEDDGASQHKWRLHGAPTGDQLLEILDEFKFSDPLIDKVVCTESLGTGCVVNLMLGPKPLDYFAWPDIRYTTDLRGYMFPHERGTHEFVDMYILAFGLSMLARYYPDLWVACIDSNCRAAKLVEASMENISERGPLLALSLLTRMPIFMANHRAPWHD